MAVGRRWKGQVEGRRWLRAEVVVEGRGGGRVQKGRLIVEVEVEASGCLGKGGARPSRRVGSKHTAKT